jgi:hypothetical protein
MKKIIVLIFLFVFVCAEAMPVFAINIGTYKTETEYGLLDGFKINWKRKDKSQKFIEAREESSKEEKVKDLKNYKESEYERTKYMYDGRAVL